MKTIHSALAASLLALLAGCTGEASSEPDAPGTLPGVAAGNVRAAGYALPDCKDPSGFCVTQVPVPSYLPPRGAFDADYRGLFYISYRPDFLSADVTYPDYYTALRVDWDGHIVSQSKSLPGRPSVQNPVIVGNRFVFGEGSRNAVMDVTGATNAFLTSAEPYAGYPDMQPNGGVVLGDGRYLSTTDFGGAALGVTGGKQGVAIECGPTDTYHCQKPATDHTPDATGYLVTSSESVTRIGVPATGGALVSWGYCPLPSGWSQINPSAPLASAPDVAPNQLHAAFRLSSGTLVDCRSTGDRNYPTLRTVSLPSVARDYEFDSKGALWIALTDQTEVAYRSPAGTIQRISLTDHPVYVKVMFDDSAVVLTAGGRFFRIRRAT